jgi:hypothetical protein
MLPSLEQLAPAEFAPAAESPDAGPTPASPPEPQPASERRAQARAARAPAPPPESKPAASAKSTSGAKTSGAKPAPVGRQLADPYANIQADMERLAKQKRCRECGGKIDPGTKVCPHCGAVLSGGMRFVRHLGGLIVLGLAVFLLVTWPYQWPPFLAKHAIRVQPPRIQAEVLKFSMEKAADNNLTFVKGIVTNHAPVQLFSVKVEFQLADRNGGVLATTAVDQQQILEAHKVWNFKALVLDPDAATVRTNFITWLR